MAPHKLMWPRSKMKIKDAITKRRKQTSLTKATLSTAICFGFPDMHIIPTTTQVTKEAPPSTVLNPISPVPLPIKDTRLEKTSGAPLPSERRVTPAIVGDNFNNRDKFSSEEQKYSEAVFPSK
uniref:Uncharacterized protein n=1 Tax=Rhizophora mucronata TaxID=61149 RepID=A0A2P2J996_RHIMU